MRILITGGSGFIAANLLRQLNKDGHELHCIVRSTSDLWRIQDLQGKITFHTDDLTDFSQVHTVFGKIGPEWVFHLATARAAADDFNSLFQGNVLMTANIISACRMFPPKKIIVFGSSLEYGHRKQPLSEKMKASPTTIFGTTKLCSTQLFLQAWRSFSLPVVILRAFSVYGPWESHKRLLPKTLLSGIYGREIQLTPPGIRRDYVFVEDVVKAALLAAEKQTVSGEIINVGTGRQTSNERAVHLIDDLTDHRLTISNYDYPRHHTDTEHWLANTEKCQELLTWSPDLTFEKGLQKTLLWLQQHLHLEEYA